MDIPRLFNITENAHRIHNPFTPEKLATLGAALRLETGTRVLDLGSGSGEMLCTWARDHGVNGLGIDLSPLFTEQAQLRAYDVVEMALADQDSWGSPAAGPTDDQGSPKRGIHSHLRAVCQSVISLMRMAVGGASA